MNARAAIAGALLLLPAAPPRAGAGPLPPFHAVRLRCSGHVTGVRVADCDGDGRRDLVVVADRRVLLFRQRAEGYPEWADDVRELPATTVLVDLWAPPGAPPRLLCLERRGVRAWRFEDGKLAERPEPFVRVTTAWHAPPGAAVLVRPMVRDVTGDGVDDLLVPVPEGYAIYSLGAGDLPPALVARLEVDLGVRVALLEPTQGRALYTEAFHPVLVAGDADGDGDHDVVVHQQGGVALYPRDADGRLPLRPSRVLDLHSVPRTRRPAIDVKLPLTIADVTGDGVLDYAQAIPGDGAVLLFAGRADRTDFATPDAVIRTAGYALGTLPRDLDGDGRLDLLVGTIDRLGILGALQVFVSKSLTVHSLLYYNRGAPAGAGGADVGVTRFADAPDDRRLVEVPLAFTTTQDGFQVGSTAVASFDGDFDGDGHRDALQRLSPTALGIWRGQGRAPYGDDPDARVPVPSTEGYRFLVPLVHDLDGDGRSDLILHYRDWEDERNQLVVLTSRP